MSWKAREDRYMENYMVRALARKGSIRALACDTTGLVNDACRLHGTFPTASAALGRALTGGVLMGALLKTRQRVGLKFEGNGPLKKNCRGSGKQRHGAGFCRRTSSRSAAKRG